VGAAEAVTADALAGWLGAARALGVRDQEAAPGRGRAKEAPRVPYTEYAGWGGGRILVGRGAADNDALTLRVAKPHDVWMHARGVAGAHVVVPLARGAQCPQGLLLDAATLAAHHSDARGADFVEVTWTERRYVRKPRKSPPGSVALDREKVLALRPEAERLARLLASRREGASAPHAA
jgi:predicted ribosome quality control (RQC) complex YloA/Tae2 family protein